MTQPSGAGWLWWASSGLAGKSAAAGGTAGDELSVLSLRERVRVRELRLKTFGKPRSIH
jgi:hypothetical protein